MRTYDAAGLRLALAKIPAASWSLPSRYDDTGVHQGYARVALYLGRRLQKVGEPFADVLADFAPVHDAFLSRTEPGGFIVPHNDVGPFYERWHVPLVASGVWQEDGEEMRPEVGVPFRVEHWRPHAVWNDGEGARIHLVIDREVLITTEHIPFDTYPVPERYAAMVAGSFYA